MENLPEQFIRELLLQERLSANVVWHLQSFRAMEPQTAKPPRAIVIGSRISESFSDVPWPKIRCSRNTPSVADVVHREGMPEMRMARLL
jgi:hypothetical protein